MIESQSAQQPPPVVADEHSSSPDVTPWFVAACIVLPILWGVFVHQIFKRIRGRSSGSQDNAWPDYQI